MAGFARCSRCDRALTSVHVEAVPALGALPAASGVFVVAGRKKRAMMRALLKFNGLLAHSWALSWCLYRLHGIRLIGSPREEIWYFAYGANIMTARFASGAACVEGVPWWRYRPLSLDAEDLSGTTLPAVAYIAQGDEDDCKPSLRYLTLLREGARAHGLPEDYIQFLEQIEHAR